MTSGRPITIVVAGSVLVGLVLAVVLLLGPASGATESVVTGSVLLAFGIGWLLLGALSIRFTDRPQRWAFVPGVAMGLVGLGLIVFAPRTPVMDVLSWLWPPALLILAVWIGVRVRRDLPGRARWLVYAVVLVLGWLRSAVRSRRCHRRATAPSIRCGANSSISADVACTSNATGRATRLSFSSRG